MQPIRGVILVIGFYLSGANQSRMLFPTNLRFVDGLMAPDCPTAPSGLMTPGGVMAPGAEFCKRQGGIQYVGHEMLTWVSLILHHTVPPSASHVIAGTKSYCLLDRDTMRPVKSY